ncbi:MAG: hypothetical protein DRN68_06915 [Thaumarchaeota archaeon]|nr:MAG: hypothetical protein DRN68_06915 [Nitrososphaerota archaeon]
MYRDARLIHGDLSEYNIFIQSLKNSIP